MKKIVQTIFVILIVLFFISCKENKQEENLDKYLNLRKQEILSEQKEIGKNEKEIIKNLKEAIRFDHLMKFVERLTYKSNLKSRKIGDKLFEFREYIWCKSSESKIKIILKYFVSNDTIRLGIIDEIEINNKISSSQLIYKIDQRFISEYTDRHNEEFSSQKSSTDLISGNGGAYYGEKETKMYCGIIQGNYDFIDVLLRSIIPEDQAIGVIGYNKLNSLQIKKNKEHDNLVTQILSVNPEINVQYTCVDKTVTIKKYLSLLDWEILPNIGLNCSNINSE